MSMSEEGKLMSSIANCTVVGHDGSRTMEPAEELANEIVRISIEDHKEGYRFLRKNFPKRDVDKMLTCYKDLASSDIFRRYYFRSGKPGGVGTQGVRAMRYLIMQNAKHILGPKIMELEGASEYMYNMMTSEMFFRNNRWCDDLCGIPGMDILKMIHQSEDYNPRKKQVA